jgi:PPOX class probable F420-dependent enzyme
MLDADDESMALDETTRQLVTGKNFATVATINPDGSPQTSVVWVGLDGEAVVFSTIANRHKARNMARDPRVSLTILNSDNPYQTVEIRGRAELVDDPAKTLPRELAHKYLGENPPPEPASVPRVIVRVVPEKVIPFSL